MSFNPLLSLIIFINGGRFLSSNYLKSGKESDNFRTHKQLTEKLLILVYTGTVKQNVENAL